MQQANIVAIFLTGLLSGGLSCMAVQGGLLAATIAQREQQRLKNKLNRSNYGNAVPLLSFLSTKLVAYTILGFLLGYLGSFFRISITTSIILNITVAVFMIGTALNILQIHPLFRYFVIQPPKFIYKLVRKESKSGDVFAPALLGAFTIFIPCGTTQAMMALAISSSSPFLGAAILFSFVLGTSPVFFLLGYFATRLNGLFQERFMQFAALAILFLAVFNLNNAASLSGRVPTLLTMWQGLYCTFSFCEILPPNHEPAISSTTINIQSSGYTPNNVTVKAGMPVSIKLINTSGEGCQASFTIAKLGIQKVVPLGRSGEVAFVAPNSPQDIPFTCSMGLYPGVIHVI